MAARGRLPSTVPTRAAAADHGVVSSVRYTDPGPLAIAHRGGAGLAPENTLAAFSRSYDLGVRWLETDVRVSSDGVVVCHHDRSLRRLTGRDAAVSDLTWAELSLLRVAGDHPLVRLDELMRTLPQARFTVDVKEPAVLPALVRDLRHPAQAARVCLAGTWDRHLHGAGLLLPEVSTALGWTSLLQLIGAARLGAPRALLRARRGGAAFAHVPDRFAGRGVLTERVVACAAELGLGVLAWTIDEPDRMRELLDLGVTGLITDRPDLLREVLIALGSWSAPGAAVRKAVLLP